MNYRSYNSEVSELYRFAGTVEEHKSIGHIVKQNCITIDLYNRPLTISRDISSTKYTDKDFSTVLSSLRHTPTWPEKRELVTMPTAILITKVCTTSAEDILLLYGACKTQPIAVVLKDDSINITAGCILQSVRGDRDQKSAQFTSNLFVISNYDMNLAVDIFSNHANVIREKEARRVAVSRKAQEAYIDEFKQNEREFVFYDKFMFEALCVKFDNNIIQLENRASVIVILDYIRYIIASRRLSGSLGALLMGILRTGAGKQFDSILFNGIRISLQENKASNGYKITKLNNHRVRAHEVEAVLNRAAIVKTQEEYDAFVSDVSGMSLEVRSLVARGVEKDLNRYSGYGLNFSDFVTLNTPELQTIINKYELDASRFFSSDNAIVRFSIRKTPRKPAEVLILGMWRTITDLDKFLTIMSSTYYRRRGVIRVVDSSGGSATANMPDNKFRVIIAMLGTLANIDTVLTPATRILDATAMGYDAYLPAAYGCNTVLINNNNLTYVVNMVTQIISELGDSIITSNAAVIKSEKLLNSVIESHQIVTLKDDNNKINAFVVKGKTGQYYTITTKGVVNKAHDASGAIASHVCIDPVSQGDMVGFDYIVSLILALSSDKSVANKIHTLGIKAGE